jgi:hypothetical protein
MENTKKPSSYTLRYEFFVLGEPDGYTEEIFSSYEDASNKAYDIDSYDIGDLIIGNITINGKPLEY